MQIVIEIEVDIVRRFVRNYTLLPNARYPKAEEEGTILTYKKIMPLIQTEESTEVNEDYPHYP